jgi:threonine/homoserine/homoserine lactone efflux protein
VFRHVLDVLPQFLVACLVLAALPGPATALFIQRTLRDGRRAGLGAVAGNEIGIFGWGLAGGAGLSVVLAANRLLFDAMHVVGACVLVLLGVQAWRSARGDHDGFATSLTSRLPRGRTPGAAFRASLVSIVANPKAAVFAVSFFPQFLPASGPVLPTAVVLATIQLVVDSIWCVCFVLLVGRAATWLESAGVRRRIERALAAILVALGLDLAASAR